jgi:hypothetical protein
LQQSAETLEKLNVSKLQDVQTNGSEKLRHQQTLMSIGVEESFMKAGVDFDNNASPVAAATGCPRNS